MRRRQVLSAFWQVPAAALVAQPAAGSVARADDGSRRLLRLAIGPENGFDPAQVSDTVSAALVGSLFESPLTYDLFTQPARLKPRTAVALPEVNADHTRFVFRIRPGILFADDPVFGGRPRELVAQDYVYSIKRFYDPAVRSPTLFHFENAGLIGLSELRRKALADKTPFPYDVEVEGLRALDRYTLEVRTARPAPRLPYVFATPPITGAVAREVIEAAGSRTMERPVGTGPYRLAEWKRRSRIVFERNPNHQSVYDEEPPPGHPAWAWVGRLKGRRLPLVDRVEFSVIEEAQPRWLAFLNGETDLAAVPAEFIKQVAPGGVLAANLARRGISLSTAPLPVTLYTYFAMENPVVGGLEPHRVALRRAVALAYDVPREIAQVRNHQAIPAQSVLPPLVSGFDPSFKTEMSDFDPQRAKALLDLYGYVDRDGDGWREQPDGTPLELEFTGQPDQLSRQLKEIWRKSMTAIGVRMSFRTGSWQENIKASRAGQLMMWVTGWSAALPDGGYFLDVLYGPNKGQANHARFDLPELNRIVERQRALPDGPERDALIREALRLSVAYMPIKAQVWGQANTVWHRNVSGFVAHPFLRDFWRYLDVEPAAS